MTEQLFDPQEATPDVVHEDDAPSREDAQSGQSADKPGDWFAVSRGVFDHPVIGIEAGAPAPADRARRPYTYTEAWISMVAKASFRRRVVRDANGTESVIDAGQLMASRRYLARKFNWTESAVRVFLAKLQKAGMIAVLAQPTPQGLRSQGRSQGSNVLTVCNYAKYQPRTNPRSQGRSQSPPILRPKENNKTKQPPYPQRGHSGFDDGLRDEASTSSDAGSESNAALWDNRQFLDRLKANDPRYWWRLIERETRDGRWPPALGPSPADEPTELHREIDERLADILASRGVPTVRQVSMPANVVPLRSIGRASA